ncbi:hypothetical protein BS47DRAFT_1371001 [Hydnum rufescens UP504]|uniref:TauD/TfdA-like domain-containing protein n=1 Tax=Hydnum rufescens UP504 TaxID=1448309 RepID=A0A9P6B694_9AGAM|nr:hypothetical protein BS47DRAFT_1371001 [Hydnum rufescens UP504]
MSCGRSAPRNHPCISQQTPPCFIWSISVNAQLVSGGPSDLVHINTPTAPSVAKIVPVTIDSDTSVDDVTLLKKHSLDKSPVVSAELKKDDGPLFPFYYPHFDNTEKFPPTEIFEHVDAGSRADPAKPHLLANATTKNLTPYIGIEIKGVQISQLNQEGLDELALYAAERKVLVFRDQDFKDLGHDRQVEIAKHFGPIQLHPTSDNVKGYPEFHVAQSVRGSNRLSKTQWHSDVTYEKQPSCTTFFFSLEQPPNSGGDTLFASQVEAYNRLSPGFQQRLEGLRAVHSAVHQADFSRKRNGPVRREPIETSHPVVRKHPVTGEKALFVNPGFTRYIEGYKQEESDNLLRFLFDHIARGADFQIRATYKPNTVVVWDNRVTVRSATNDFPSKLRRHAVRLTPQGEIPVPA